MDYLTHLEKQPEKYQKIAETGVKYISDMVLSSVFEANKPSRLECELAIEDAGLEIEPSSVDEFLLSVVGHVYLTRTR